MMMMITIGGPPDLPPALHSASDHTEGLWEKWDIFLDIKVFGNWDFLDIKVVGKKGIFWIKKYFGKMGYLFGYKK